MAYYELYSNHFRPYNEYPNTSTTWRNLITSNPYNTFYKGSIVQWSASGETGRVSSSTHGYLCYGNNENNTSFDVFYVATTDTYGMGPFMFNIGSGTSKAAQWGGTSNGMCWGVWKVGTISASTRNEAKTFSDFVMIALNNDPNNGYSATESITVSSALKEKMQDNTKSGAVYSGCYDITTSATVGPTVVMGQDVVTVDVSITGNPYTCNLLLTTLSEVLLKQVNGTAMSWNEALPYSLEQYFNDNELRKQTNLKVRMKLDGVKPVFLNGQWQEPASLIGDTGDYYFSSSNFYLQIDSTKLPTFTSISGTKETSHNSQYVMLVNGSDKITFAATIQDQSYPLNNNYANYVPTFALYIGDANLGNYRPTSVSSSNNVLTTTYNGVWGPLTVNPPVSLGTNQTLRAVYQDRFGRQASSNIPIKVGTSTVNYQRFYNYTNPTWELVGKRVNASGTPDERNGTYIKIDYNWALSLLDYSMSPHTGTAQPTIKITNNQDTSTHSYTITKDTGSNSFTVSDKPLDKSYTFTAVLTDAAGRTFSLSCFVPSGEVFMDFMAGGSGLGIGKRAEAADTLSIAWDTEIKQKLQVDGEITGPTITDIYDKISKAGTGSGGDISVTGTAQTSITKITDPLTYSNGSSSTSLKMWKGIAIPLGALTSGNNSAFVILTSCGNSMTLSGTTSFSFPYTFQYGTTSYNPIVLLSNQSHGGTGSSSSLYATVTSGTSFSLTAYSSGTKNFSLCVIGVVTNYWSSNPVTAMTTLNLSADGSGGGSSLTIAQVEAAITAALANYPSNSDVTTMINNALSNTVTRATVSQMIADATIQASKVAYSNTSSGMTATTAQAAIDELKKTVDTKANSSSLVNYYNKTEIDNKLVNIDAGLSEQEVKDIVDEKLNDMPSNEAAIATANEAKTTAAEAKGIAESAESAADTAILRANTARDTANEANTTAGTAKTIAEGIEGKADLAITTANTANTTATEAKQIAEDAMSKIDQAIAGVAPSAADVSFDDTISLGVTNVQLAIVKTNEKILTSTQIQTMIDAKFNSIVNGNNVKY